MTNNSLHSYFREHFVLPLRGWVYRYVRRLLLILIAALLANFAFSYFFYTPKMWALREVAAQSVAEYELLQRKIALASEQLAVLKSREQGIYRAIFSQDTLKWNMGSGDLIDGGDHNYGRYNRLVATTEHQLSALKAAIYRATVSLDDIELLAQSKDAMAERVPAIWPVDRSKVRGHIGAFGSRLHPISRRILRHDGIDFSGPIGTEIVATGNGVIVVDKARTGYGNQVMIDHGFGYKTRYAHLSKILVVPGQEVKRGQKIGLMGNTGRSTGPHLHYEVIHRGVPVDPISYFARDMSSDEFKKILEQAREITYEIE